MEFIKNNTNELESTLVLKIVEQDYKERVDTELKKINKTAKIKGFRPGFVPKQMIEKMYGKDVIAHEVSKMVDEKLNEYIKSENIELVGEVLASETEKTLFDVENSKEFQFAFDIAVFQKTDIDVTTLTVPFYKMKVTDDKIDDEIEKLREKYGEFVEADKIEKDSKITVKLVELDGKKAPKTDGIVVDDVNILIKFVENPAKDQLLAAKKDESLVIKLKESIKNDTELSSLLKIDKAKLPEISENFEITINKIENHIKAEFEAPFFDKLFGEGVVKDVEQLRAKLLELYQQQYDNEAKTRFSVDFKKVIESQIEIQLPDEFLIRWQMERQNKPAEEIRKHITEYKDAIKWDRILNILAKQFNLQVEYEDLLQASRNKILATLYQYGMDPSMFPEDTLNKYASEELEKMNEHDKNLLFFDTIEKKVIEGVFDKVIKDPKEISFDDFLELYKKEQKMDAETIEDTENEDQDTEVVEEKKKRTRKKKDETEEK